MKEGAASNNEPRMKNASNASRRATDDRRHGRGRGSWLPYSRNFPSFGQRVVSWALNVAFSLPVRDLNYGPLCFVGEQKGVHKGAPRSRAHTEGPGTYP